MSIIGGADRFPANAIDRRGGQQRDSTGNPPNGGDGGDGVEARIAVLESDVSYIKRDIGEMRGDIKDLREEVREDFRITFGALIFVALGLAGMMAKGFHWL